MVAGGPGRYRRAMTSPARVRAVTPDDWRLLRTLRLEMLADTPLAYLETLATAEVLPDVEWQARARRNAAPGSASFAAEDEDGRWIGTMTVFRRDDVAYLVSVYVTPARRGREAGVTDALLDRVIEWARAQNGVTELRLEVHEQNPRATAYYRRRGFEMTGRSTPYALDRSQLDLEMSLPLAVRAEA
jgi:GNAT superfamily N-acetyltransferase